MRRLAVVFAILLAGTAMSACKSTNEWKLRYDELHEEYMQTVADRDEKHEHLVQALQREEVAQQQNSMAQREVGELRTRAEEAAKRAQEYAARLQEMETVAATPVTPDTSLPVVDEDAAIQAHAQRLAASAPSEAGDIKVTEDGNIEITLESDVTFKSGDAKLTSAGQKSLRQLQNVLSSTYGAYKIRVEGHTDNTPLKRTKAKWGDNFGLGSARSLSVVRFMESGLGIDPVRLESASRGEHAPVASNKSKADRAKNRRVAIVVVIPRSAALAQAK